VLWLWDDSGDLTYMPTPTHLPLGARPLVVVVDDDASIRRALVRSLTAEGLEVKALATASELLAQVQLERPACVIIDVHLPDMNGFALMRRVLDGDRRMQVVMITADSDPTLEARALAQGAAALVTKPFDPDRLLDELHALLASTA
jgi:FixJ family two-component response regulator